MSEAAETAEVHEGQLVDTVADHVNKLHENVRGAVFEATKTVVEIGQKLSEKKASMAHGEWSSWIAENLHFSSRTVRRYIKAAKAAEGDGLPFDSLKSLYGPDTPVDGHERDAGDGERDGEDVDSVAAAIIKLNKTIEDVELPVKDAESFVAEAGDDFLSEKAAKRLEWLVSLYDVLTNKAQLPGK